MPTFSHVLALCFVLLLGCSADQPEAVAYLVEPGSQCHQLLLAQCACCPEAELNCSNDVEWGVSRGALWMSVPDTRCAASASQAAADPEQFCATLDTAAEHTAACRGFTAPAQDPDAVTPE
ncbi:MAG: hypothetical protein ACI9WU_005504 [Myxococcota bacterium]